MMTETAMNDPVSILIVDDRPENLLSLEALLRDESIAVIKAGSGREALRLTLKHELALVLLDVQMPDMDGFETAELMRGNPKTKGVPIIFVTAGEKSVHSMFKGYESGAVDYIYKPVDPVILCSKVRIFSELYSQRRAIERHEQQLEKLVEERTRELRQALRRAEASSKAKSEFLANTSHEIRTPMTAIQGAIDLLSADHLTDEQRQYFDMISTAANNLLILIDNILDLSEIEAGRVAIDNRRFSLRSCLEEVIATQIGRIREKQLDFLFEVNRQTPDSVCGDPLRLKQIVFNLLGNAIKFTQQGEVGLKVSSLSNGDASLLLQLQISDTGVGIGQEALTRIFEPFVQADSSMTRRFGGVGLGLSICQRLTSLMGGEIQVESTEGAGSTFTVTLPMTIGGR
ncbi:MAG: response regulator [Desulfuromonas sp.]|nr:response regulator [Desulfuromonas sp.]